MTWVGTYPWEKHISPVFDFSTEQVKNSKNNEADVILNQFAFFVVFICINLNRALMKISSRALSSP
jgi:hypothetical protein